MTEYTMQKYDIRDYENIRDTMTLNDIVRYLLYIKRSYISDYNFSDDEDDLEKCKLHIAISKAIDIIRKIAESEEE